MQNWKTGKHFDNSSIVPREGIWFAGRWIEYKNRWTLSNGHSSLRTSSTFFNILLLDLSQSISNRHSSSSLATSSFSSAAVNISFTIQSSFLRHHRRSGSISWKSANSLRSISREFKFLENRSCLNSNYFVIRSVCLSFFSHCSIDRSNKPSTIPNPFF